MQEKDFFEYLMAEHDDARAGISRKAAQDYVSRARRLENELGQSLDGFVKKHDLNYAKEKLASKNIPSGSIRTMTVALGRYVDFSNHEN